MNGIHESAKNYSLTDYARFVHFGARGAMTPLRMPARGWRSSGTGLPTRHTQKRGYQKMDYVKPNEVVATMAETAVNKSRLSIKDMLLRGFLSGALLGYATSLAITGTLQTGVPLVGAIIFPCSFVIILLLGLELVTGNFALLPMGLRDGSVTPAQVLRNWGWVFFGNLLGSLFYAGLLWVSLSDAGSVAVLDGVGAAIVGIAEAKTTAYASLGVAGMVTVFVKAILCNWMVCLGVVMAMVSKSTIGKIVGAWLPVSIFFAQGFEHAVVNMFVIPAGMLMGADVGMGQWWFWNQIPVTLGNIVGGALFIGIALQLTYAPKRARVHSTAQAAAPATEIFEDANNLPVAVE